VLLRSIAAATLMLSLGACVQRDYLVANPSADGIAPAETRYTANISYVASVEVIALRIDPVFATGERQEILRAIAEWNHALNGYAPTAGVSCQRAVRRRSVSASPGRWRCCSPRPTAAAW
jgi:hypothetical protein